MEQFLTIVYKANYHYFSLRNAFYNYFLFVEIGLNEFEQSLIYHAPELYTGFIKPNLWYPVRSTTTNSYSIKPGKKSKHDTENIVVAAPPLFPISFSKNAEFIRLVKWIKDLQAICLLTPKQENIDHNRNALYTDIEEKYSFPVTLSIRRDCTEVCKKPQLWV